MNLPLLGAIDVATRVDRNLLARLKGLPHSKPESRILLGLSSLRRISDSILAEQIGMNGPQLSRDVRPLIEKGLVSFEPSPKHQRQRLLSLTTTGRAAVDEINAVRLATLDDILPQLTPADRRAITTLFKIDQDRIGEPAPLSLRAVTEHDLLAAFQKMTAGEAAKKTHFVAQSANILRLAFERWDGPKFAGVVHEDNRGALGAFCLLIRGSLDPQGPDQGTMTMIGPYVDPYIRRQKLGHRMLQRCLSVAKDLQQEFLTTDASTRTPDLEAFLKVNWFRKSRASSRIDLRDYVSEVHTYTRALR